MTALFLYGAVLLMAASVIVNRIGQRRMAAARKSQTEAEALLRTLDHGLLDSARTVHQATQRNATLDDQIHDARLAVEHATAKLDQARAAEMERYYIFDRLDARPGTIWTMDVRRTEEAGGGQRLAAAWPNPRNYLIVAATAREAMDRAAQRFPNNHGFEIGTATPCHLFKSKRPSQGSEADSPTHPATSTGHARNRMAEQISQPSRH